MAWPREVETQQGGAWSGEPESTAKEKEKERGIRKMFKILREVWLDIGIEKVDTHEGVTVMKIEWDYSYYQPWFDNEWLVDEMIAMREETLMAQNENITMQ